VSTSDHHVEDDFIENVADVLNSLPGVDAVALGGSWAQGTSQPDSDWDVAVYYQRGFDPQDIRALSCPGQLSDLGGWGRILDGGRQAHRR
jgi:predicted nucleotidyltransferase